MTATTPGCLPGNICMSWDVTMRATGSVIGPGLSHQQLAAQRPRRRRKKGRAVKPGPGTQDPRSIFSVPGLKPEKRGESCSRVRADCNTTNAKTAAGLDEPTLDLTILWSMT